MMTVLFVDGVDLAVAYPVAAAELAAARPPVVGARVAGLGVPGALIEVSTRSPRFPLSSGTSTRGS